MSAHAPPRPFGMSPYAILSERNGRMAISAVRRTSIIHYSLFIIHYSLFTERSATGRYGARLLAQTAKFRKAKLAIIGVSRTPQLCIMHYAFLTLPVNDYTIIIIIPARGWFVNGKFNNKTGDNSLIFCTIRLF